MWSRVPRQLAAMAGVLSLSALSQSCLIAPPDQLEPAERIPPRAIVSSAVPAVTRIVQTSREGEDPTFNVPFVSDDRDEEVVGRLFLNYPTGRYITGVGVAPGTLGEVRNMQVPWVGPRNEPAGCYSITMTITHADNYTAKPAIVDASKTAFITWWVAHDTDPQTVNLDECGPTEVNLPN